MLFCADGDSVLAALPSTDAIHRCAEYIADLPDIDVMNSTNDDVAADNSADIPDVLDIAVECRQVVQDILDTAAEHRKTVSLLHSSPVLLDVVNIAVESHKNDMVSQSACDTAEVANTSPNVADILDVADECRHFIWHVLDTAIECHQNVSTSDSLSDNVAVADGSPDVPDVLDVALERSLKSSCPAFETGQGGKFSVTPDKTTPRFSLRERYSG
jgi:hypothetical protein